MVSSTRQRVSCLFFFNDTATTEIYTLSLHDALPICPSIHPPARAPQRRAGTRANHAARAGRPLGDLQRKLVFEQQSRVVDRKSTRLNSSHVRISYAVFCLKKQTGPRSNTDALLADQP